MGASKTISLVSTLLEMSRDVCHRISHLGVNSKRHRRLTRMAIEVSEKLNQFGENVPQEDLVFMQKELQYVIEVLDKQRIRSTYSAKIAEAKITKLVEVERKLESIFRVLKLWSGSQVCNKSTVLPVSQVGLERGEHIVEFLQRSQSQNFRLVAMYGEPGVGKTTLLNYVWDKVAWKAPFEARAYVQIGHDANLQTIYQLQTDVLRQLCGHIFPDSAVGRDRLMNCLEKLKADKKPLFLVLDNVFNVEDLVELLPNKLSSILAASSCIAVTCRNYRIVTALLDICDLQKHDPRVCCFKPPCLNIERSVNLFVECASMDPSAPEDKDLLDALVPLCVGLPLALTILGKAVRSNSKRNREVWKRVQRQWKVLDDDDSNSLPPPVQIALKISFEVLHESRQIALLDIVSLFYGWNVARVEPIVGVDVLRDLIDSSLVWLVDDYTKCNRNALRRGYDLSCYSNPKSKEWISMHDLTLKYGENLISYYGENHIRNSFNQFVTCPPSRFSPQPHTLRSVRLVTEYGINDQIVLEFLQSTTNLWMLYWQAKHNYFLENDEPFIDRGSSRKALVPEHPIQQLRSLFLKKCNLSRSIMEMKVSREIKVIALHECDDIQELPNIPLHNLERLEILCCDNFKAFSKSQRVKEWSSLKELILSEVPEVRSLPEELGDLNSLKAIYVRRCAGLKEFPSLRSPQGPSILVLEECDALEALGPISCPLQSLHLSKLPIQMLEVLEAHVTSLTRLSIKQCPNLLKLPAAIVNASLLQSLSIKNCARLVELLPYEEIGNMVSLTKLRVHDCKSLERLPAGMFQKASSLQKLKVSEMRLVTLPAEIGRLITLIQLDLDYCGSLVELPEQIGGLTYLRSLLLVGPNKLEMLPNSIGNMSSLESLHMDFCESLAKLPEQIGGLTSLRTVSLGGCKKLEKLPDSIGNMSSLESLLMGSCESLAELPEQIGGLTSLRSLSLVGPNKLEKLPDSIGNMSSLESLHMDFCESLVELPEQIGGLTSLRTLSLGGCKKLKKLPDSIGNMSSLESLLMGSCESLAEFPEQIGGLTSLRKLWLKGCKKLEKVPDSIGNVSSLEWLHMDGCESVVELPEQIGGLTSLTELTLEGCKKLEELPESIGNMSSLEYLNVYYCESLAELPEQIGGLTSLRKLWMDGCKKLEKLPDSIRNMLSLEWLHMDGCESVVELPEQIGGLTSLTELTLQGCKKLEKLPDSIGNMSSLECLDVYYCESLAELPEQMGDLTSLRNLWMNGCKKLEKLPDSIGNMSSLDWLRMDGCESLVELPEQIGGLTSLTRLSLEGCKKLEKLPDSIGNMSSLEILGVDNCESLAELPEQIGGLTSLRSLSLEGCKKLEKLPDSIGNMPSLWVSGL